MKLLNTKRLLVDVKILRPKIPIHLRVRRGWHGNLRLLSIDLALFKLIVTYGDKTAPAKGGPKVFSDIKKRRALAAKNLERKC
jgi:hypothetical protein